MNIIRRKIICCEFCLQAARAKLPNISGLMSVKLILISTHKTSAVELYSFCLDLTVSFIAWLERTKLSISMISAGYINIFIHNKVSTTNKSYMQNSRTVKGVKLYDLPRLTLSILFILFRNRNPLPCALLVYMVIDKVCSMYDLNQVLQFLLEYN